MMIFTVMMMMMMMMMMATVARLEVLRAVRVKHMVSNT
jgi:hypothetical protein